VKSSELALLLTESELQQRIIDRAEALGWLVYHTYDSRRSASGFPDLVLAREGRVIFVEVKAEKGRLSKSQAEWLRELGIGKPSIQSEYVYRSHEVYVWRPSDIAWIKDVLV